LSDALSLLAGRPLAEQAPAELRHATWLVKLATLMAAGLAELFVEARWSLRLAAKRF